ERTMVRGARRRSDPFACRRREHCDRRLGGHDDLRTQRRRREDRRYVPRRRVGSRRQRGCGWSRDLAHGVNTLDVIERVKEKLTSLEAGLPPGVKIVPFYDRTELIERATRTLKRALIEEIILVTLAHVVFLFHFRSILIVTIPLPLAVLTSFLLMYYA